MPPIMAAVSAALPNGNPLSSADSLTANNALSAPTGTPLVDTMDRELLTGVLGGVDSCVAAAATRGTVLAPIAFLYVAPWINMSGPPTLLNVWLSGSAVHGVPSPNPPTAGRTDLQAYLQATAYFQAHPRNFAHYEQCVQKGIPLLPNA